MNKNSDQNKDKETESRPTGKQVKTEQFTSSAEGDTFTHGEAGQGQSQTYAKQDFSASGDEESEMEGGDARFGAENTREETRRGDYAEEADPAEGGGDENSDQDARDEQIAKLEEELATAKDTVLRKAAEFENLKRRTQKEKALMREDARADAVSKFLPFREDLKRSLKASEKQEVSAGFLEGLKLMLDNFDRVLEDYNVEPIEETGVPFDVDKHDAMLSQPVEDDSIESNTVIQVLEPGYKIGDRVIKHAKVIVSQ